MAVLTTAAVLVGLVGWSGILVLLPVAMLFPALWAIAPSRFGAVLISAGYFLAASRGLPQGVANFYGNGMLAGIGLWFAASATFVLVHAALWTSRSGWGRTLLYCAAAVLMSVPPFGIIGWAHPITAAGILFPGWSWFGLAAAAIGLMAMTTRAWPIATVVLGGLSLWSAAMWTPPDMPDGWVGVDTQFRGENGQYADYAQQLETIALVRDAAAAGGSVIVLPESAAGIWTPTTERLWRAALRELDVIVNVGAIEVGRDGYDNVMAAITRSDARIIYRERMPVPVSMWQPWLEWTGQGGGARANFFANPVVDFAGQRVAPLICYEQLLIWPILQSALHFPDIIVASGNGWWTDNTNIVAIQRAATMSWARLFDLPLVMAFNT